MHQWRARTVGCMAIYFGGAQYSHAGFSDLLLAEQLQHLGFSRKHGPALFYAHVQRHQDEDGINNFDSHKGTGMYL